MSFGGDIAKFAEKAKSNSNKVVKKVVFDISSRLVYRTPVGDPSYWQSPPPPGYVGGRARGNWQYALDAPNLDGDNAIDPLGASTLDGIIAEIPTDSAAGHVHYITNTLPYIKRLEEGYSRQAPPQGIVALTVMEYKDIVSVAVSEVNQ